MSITNHVSEVAVPGQAEIHLRASHGELEIAQTYDHAEHAIYVNAANALTLVRAILHKCGMDNVYLYRKSGGLCHDVEWPDDLALEGVVGADIARGPFTDREVAMMSARPDIDWQPALRDFAEIEGSQLPLRLVNGADHQEEALHAAE